ncbi:MAG: beta-ketoacyl-[acyl-carrier-protein] synthase family protein [Nitrospinota bacterium]|nr:beta-ketoacyl-[acyl-carrier-protein] synthase family protein [Nitrospinota bacterium]MDH5756488.1 beta-ketoacyl-[acyl-carrier-protein] synthase family protein [Nitrospinota bacterium]
MGNKRVVITGVGAISPLGGGVEALMSGIADGKSAVRYLESWKEYKGLRTYMGAPARLENENKIPRQKRRSMGVMSIFAVQAAEEAVADAGLDLSKTSPHRVGSIIGSTMGSAISINSFFEQMLPDKTLAEVPAMLFFKGMGHSAAVNVAQYFGLTGYIMATAAACASGLQAIGTGYNLLRLGVQDVILCGGTEELHPTASGVFDNLFATSTKYADTPHKTPRPFDIDRDGIICGEGSGMVVLETLEHAQARGARVYAEIRGFNITGDVSHLSQLNTGSMKHCISQTLQEASIAPDEVDYINAHATATLQGDEAEASAIADLFGDSVPVSSLKGYFGHTLAASGAIELIATLKMMEAGIVYPGLNLDNIDPKCQGIYHPRKAENRQLDTIVKNCFAFGGVNTSMVCRRI